MSLLDDIGNVLMGGARIIPGILKKNDLEKEAKGLVAKRKPFKTTQEVYDIQNATESRAQTGYDAATLEYLTNEINRASSGVLGTAKRLGGNANDLSALFDQSLNSLMKVGAENAALSMENFSKYLAGKELLSKNLDAEWASEQGILKDKLQSVQKQRDDAAAQITNTINSGISLASSLATGGLYKAPTQSNAPANFVSPTGSSAAADGMAATGDYFDFSGIGYRSPGYLPDATTDTFSDGSVSQVVTPSLSAMRRGGQNIIGVASDGSFIYGR